MKVFVLNKDGEPLMPTTPRNARKLLDRGSAKVRKRTPFTIQLTYDTTHYTQPVSLGVDSGSKHIGLSASTEDEELFSSEVELRDDIKKRIAARKVYRRHRRYRLCRYRKDRFSNRVGNKPEGWLPPSTRTKILYHVQAIDSVMKMLPITDITVETGAFDFRALNPDQQKGFWNTREYVLERDNHECQACHGKSGDKILQVHHIESRETGGNTPDNLITLCKTCHDKYHQGKLNVSFGKGKSYKDWSFMNRLKNSLIGILRKKYPEMEIGVTHGADTKTKRIEHGIAKSHCLDALCISGHPTARPSDVVYYQRRIREHNRQLHKANLIKGGKRKANQTAKYTFGFKRYDKVRSPDGQERFVVSRRARGSFVLKRLDGTNKSEMTYKKLTLLERSTNTIIERRVRSMSSCFVTPEATAA